MVGRRVEDWLVRVLTASTFRGTRGRECWVRNILRHNPIGWKINCQNWAAIARSLASILFATMFVDTCGCCCGFPFWD
jgi:hypothetical protein